jgi:hypothetical protein
MTSDPNDNKPAADIDDDLDEPLGTPATCSMEEGCESCQ